jgi:hypothetical protein
MTSDPKWILAIPRLAPALPTIITSDARRARGEADFLTSRALKPAPDNDEVKKLRYEVVKLLELKRN